MHVLQPAIGGLQAVFGTHVSPSFDGSCVSRHLQSTPSSLAFSGHLAMQPFPFGWTFCPLVVQPVQVCSPPGGVVHVLQPAIGGLQAVANATAKTKVNPSNIRPGRLFVSAAPGP